MDTTHERIRERIGGACIDPADPRSRVVWQARWLQDPVFEGLPYRECVHPDRRPENDGEIQNVHTFFRRAFFLEARAIRAARLYCTADDCYKLYVNGVFVGTGPAPAYPARFPYNAWDVTPFLRSGEQNAIGLHAFYHGMHSLTYPSGDNLQGALVQLEIEFDDQAPGTAATVVLVSDQQWRFLRTDAYACSHVFGYQTSFAEDIDLRKLPRGWSRPEFDDSDWQTPLAGDVPSRYQLVPQGTPAVDVFKRHPVRIVRKGDGHYFIDFGSELAGSTVFMVSGPAGHTVEIRHGEELFEADTVRYDMRCNCRYQEFCTLSGQPDEELEFFDYKGFRYVEVLQWPEPMTPERVWALERHYPFPESASRFESSNHLLNDIWKVCRNGVRVGTMDTYLDCPTREKGGFMGDGFITGMSHLILTGDARILRKFLLDMASTQDYCPGLHSTGLNYVNGELAEYSLLWPVLLEYYYEWTGDLEFVREMMPVMQTLLAYYSTHVNESGVLQNVMSPLTGSYPVLVDWPENLRDGYDDPYLQHSDHWPEPREVVVNTMLQGFYSYALQAAGRLSHAAGATSITDWLKGRVGRLHAAMREQLLDPHTGYFVDRNASSHSSLHANVMPLLSGMLTPAERARAVELIRAKRLRCGVYFSYFVLKALCDAGEHDLGYDIMTSDDLHSWHSMLEAGATTCMEAWAPDLKWNTSWCHPWSSAPIPLVAHEIMGLRPATPGWTQIRFAPRPPADLRFAELTMTVPKGTVSASFVREGNEVTYRLRVPEGCATVCEFAGSDTLVTLDGATQPCRTSRDQRGIPCTELVAQIRSGEHVIITRSGNRTRGHGA